MREQEFFFVFCVLAVVEGFLLICCGPSLDPIEYYMHTHSLVTLTLTN